MSKISAIVVAGDTSRLDQDEEFVKKLSRWLPPSARAFIFANDINFDQNYLGTKAISKDKFLYNSSRIIRDLDNNDIFHFIQVGHGSPGPKLILEQGPFGSGLYENELMRLFSENLNPKANPFLSMILHGCFSGGFAKYFWDKNGAELFVPDFFLGASPPGALATSTPMPLFDDSTEKCDFNKDGLVTLRESGVCFLNGKYNHFGILFSKKESHDISIDGRQAVKPYFPKAVERQENHSKLIETLESLRFGEQMIVFFEGAANDKKLAEWFKNEAEGGDGFYKFVTVPDNPESRKFFKTEKSSVFAMGPNLVYSGVRLKDYSPIGGQIPFIVSTQDVYFVMKDWEHKLTADERSNFNHNLSLLEKEIREDPGRFFAKVRALLSDGEINDVERGLLYLTSISIRKFNDETNTSIIDLAERFAGGKVMLSDQYKLYLFELIRILPDDPKKLEIAEKINNQYIAKTSDQCIVKSGMSFEKFKSIVESLKSGKAEDIKIATEKLKCANLEPDQGREIMSILKELVSPSNIPEIRRIAVKIMDDLDRAWIKESFFFCGTDNDCLEELAASEKDNTVLTYILYWHDYSVELDLLEAYKKPLKKVSSDNTNPASVYAKKLLERMERRKKVEEAEFDDFFKARTLDMKLGVGDGLLTVFKKDSFSTAGLYLSFYLSLRQIIAASDDMEESFYVGIRPTAAIDLSWKRGWISFMGGGELFFQFAIDNIKRVKYNSFELSFVLAGGAVAEYNPVKEWDNANFGYTASLAMMTGQPRSRYYYDEGPDIGGILRLFYFPNTEEYMATLGVLFDFNL